MEGNTWHRFVPVDGIRINPGGLRIIMAGQTAMLRRLEASASRASHGSIRYVYGTNRNSNDLY